MAECERKKRREDLPPLLSFAKKFFRKVNGADRQALDVDEIEIRNRKQTSMSEALGARREG